MGRDGKHVKYKSKRRLQGMTAWALTLCLTVGMFGSLPVLAQQASEAGAQLSGQKWTPDEEIRLNTVGDMSLEELSDAVLPESDKPELVGEAAIAEKGHVHRLREQEPDLNTVIFQNRDGTKTMYQYGGPVKYIDEAGQVRDKRNTLETDVKTAYAADYGYVNSENDIRTYFPKNLNRNKGVLLENDDVKLELRPVQGIRRQPVAVQAAQQGEAASVEQVTQAVAAAGGRKTLQAQAAGERDTQVMEYAGVFGAGTALRYTPTFEGFKEDIILSSASAGHEFVFEVDAGGLQAVAEDGAIHFLDPLTGEIKAGMDPIYVYDSYTGERTEENPHDSYDNQLLCEPAEGGKYRVTIVADEAFLNDPSTVYPVYVDPTITVNTSGSGWTKTIEDAVVFSGQPYSNQNNNKYMHVGYVDTTYGVGRALIRFPGLRDNAAFNSLEDDQITSVKFYIYKTNDVSSTEDTVVEAYRYTGPSWTETDATYCSVDTGSYTDLQDEQVVYGTQQKYIGFDITEAARLWRTNYTASNRGILLKNLNEYYRSYDRNFLSTRMGTNKPYVQVDYENSGLPAQPGIESGSVFYIKSDYSGYYLDVANGATANGSGLQQTTFNGSAAQQFELYRDSYTGYYYISPQNAKDKYLTLNTSNQVVLSDDCTSSRALWRIKEESNATYSFINRYTESNYGYTMAPSGNACALSAAITGQPYEKTGIFRWKLIVPVTRLTINSRHNQVMVGQSVYMTVIEEPSNSTTPTIWESSDPSIASIDNSAKLVAKKVGIVTITARSSLESYVYDTFTVEVTNKYTELLRSLTNNEVYYLYSPLTKLVESNIPLEQRLDFLAVFRRHVNKTNVDELREDLEEQLGIPVELSDTYLRLLQAEYELGAQGYYNPETQYALTQQYLTTLRTFFSIVTFQMAARLTPFDASGNIRYSPTTLDLQNDIAHAMTNNNSANKVMLGTNALGVQWNVKARECNMTYFYSTYYNQLESTYGKDFMTEVNRQFLTQQVQAGKEIWLSHDPWETLRYHSDSSFAMELNWLKDYYGISEFTESNFSKIGDIWKLIP